MALRLIKTHLPKENGDELLEIVDEHGVEESWTTPAGDDCLAVEMLVEVSDTESVVEAIETRFGSNENFRLLILSVEGVVPRPELEGEEEDGEDNEESGSEEANDDNESKAPIAIEELYDDVTSGMAADGSYTVMVLLSSIVAAIGILRNDVAMVIAAMIIAPLLKPNMALSLATTLADQDLAKRSLWVNVYGVVLSVGVSMVFGFIFALDPTTMQVTHRTQLGMLELVLAASAGAAGAVSFTSGAAEKVVGVMVAVALLPPVVVFGMLAGAGEWNLALGAFLLTVANVVCLNLAGVTTFFLQRIRPRNAFESKRARRALRNAIVIWVVLLAILVVILVFGGEFRRYP